ncbi:MAG: hypothetical protein ABI364_04850 [Caldimonas sp.]
MRFKSSLLISTVVSAFALSGCGGGGNDGTNGQTALVSMAAVAAGASCATGGTAVSVGLDTNGDGVLGASEVTSTKYVCNGADGATGIAGSAGATGATGSTGATGATGTSGTSGTNGVSALAALTLEVPGANCTRGGTRVDVGADSNANGVLDAAEVTSTQYICNGVALPWVNVTAATQQTTSNTSYVANFNAFTTLTLPASPAVGDTVGVTGGLGGWKFAQNAGQTILVGDASNVKSTLVNYATSGAGNSNWGPVASDAAGTNVFAASSSSIVVSHDGGATWVTSLAIADNWRGLAVTPDGQIVYAVSFTGVVEKSTDGGSSWVSLGSSPGGQIERVATSANGQVVLLAGDGAGGNVSLSTDGGATFTPVAGQPGSGRWVSASVSNDGVHLIATQNATIGFNQTFASNDGGTTWALVAVPTGVQQSAFSGDGKTLVGLTHQGTDNSVYISKDLGVTWIKSLAIPGGGGNLLRLSVSKDGRVIALGLFSGPAWVSYNGGIDWVSNNSGPGTSWYGVSVSGDGSKVFIGDTNNGLIKIGTEGAAPSLSTAGATGYLDGAQYSGATIQYIGNNTWLMINSIGPTFVF